MLPNSVHPLGLLLGLGAMIAARGGAKFVEASFIAGWGRAVEATALFFLTLAPGRVSRRWDFGLLLVLVLVVFLSWLGGVYVIQARPALLDASALLCSLKLHGTIGRLRPVSLDR